MTKPKVLVVDDIAENRKAFSAVLEKIDVEIFLASEGNEALGLMIQHDFAVVLLDVQLPGMDGIEIAELMRGVEKTRLTPIIFVTAANRNPTLMFKGYDAGAVDFLFKPFDPQVLLSKVKIFCDLNTQAKLLQAQMMELKAAKEKLSRARDAAEAANRSKDAFLANMSHEIRTPLGVISGFVDLLRNFPENKTERDRWLSLIKKNANQLSSLINDILDLSKIESGKVEIEQVKFDLQELLDEVIASLMVKASERGVSLSYNLSEDFPKLILCDQYKIRQIYMNIIGNAIKFTNEGKVSVEGSLLDADETAVKFEILVRDTGVGLDENERSNLFKRFSQADNSTTRKFGGSGLGLVLARELARALGGNVDLVDSEKGKGSVFSVTIRASLAAAKSASPSAPAVDVSRDFDLGKEGIDDMLDGFEVLVVEDMAEMRDLVTLVLEGAGARVDVAGNGAEALERANERRYDVVLMDLQMPVMDGYEAIKRLRASGYSEKVYALTANAMKGQEKHTTEIGFDGYLTKPFNKNELILTVRSSRNIPRPVEQSPQRSL